MATSHTSMDYLLDQLSGTGQVRARKMFGEYCLYFADKPVALVCDDQLFLKSTSAGHCMIQQKVTPIPARSPIC